MSHSIKLIVGLGNPGADYAATRHNAGSWLVEKLAAEQGVNLAPSKFFGATATVNLAGQKVHLLIPSTFMNLSGKAVAALANFYKIAVEEILIAHDELDLPPGTVKLKQGGGHGGHNGLRDSISALGNNNKFYRLRLGIGHPGQANKVTGYVLGKAPAAEQEQIDAAVDAALLQLDKIVRGDQAAAMNQLHNFKA